MRIGVVGEFSNYPSRPELTKFLKAEGAQVVSKVTGDLDVMILGTEGVSGAQAQIRKANRDGASIRTVKAVSELFVLTPRQHVAVIRDRKTMRRFLQIAGPDRPWMMRFDRRVENEQFRNLILAGASRQPLGLQQFLFGGCTFDSCKLSEVQFGMADACFAKSRMIDCNLTRVSMIQTNQSECENVRANKLEIGAAKSSSFQQVTVRQLTLRTLERCNLDHCEILMDESNLARLLSANRRCGASLVCRLNRSSRMSPIIRT